MKARGKRNTSNTGAQSVLAYFTKHGVDRRFSQGLINSGNDYTTSCLEPF